ncbi:hypothetical protein D9Q98_010460 [Chlorella vulgaris]|uniref:Glycosyltransferase 61 catalytic domain-containing protein n=1 Tax=Chlorella vulgaris TaxID=3077 RepID=A0A9D4TS84_CHLVU|nr:hypothetical protein D9Q98_010460 [Chlorella vulgaris]
MVAPRSSCPWLNVMACGLLTTILLFAYLVRDSGLCYIKERAVTANHTWRQSHTAECPTQQEVEASPWAQNCYLVKNVCVDRGMLVLYDDRYQPAPVGGGETPPQFAAENNYGQFIYQFKNGGTKYGFPLDTIRSRAASSDEGTEYLRSPVFSSCTVPIVWYPFWMTNFGHFLRDNCAKLYGFIQDTKWRDAIKLVQMTAEGLAIPDFNYALLQPMTSLSVETWADFTSRLLPGASSLVQPGAPPSAEGHHHRCFESMFVCTHGLNITRWPLHAFGRHVVKAYRHLLPPEIQELDGISSSSDSDDDGGAVLNVVIQKRPGDTRQLLNMEELLSRCNVWQHRTRTGLPLRAKCWEAEVVDLVSGMAAAQIADVFVGTHGANLANGWLMRPGASMIEVQPYGFDAHVPHLQDPLFNAQDNETQVMWWVLMGCDPTAWRASPEEAAGHGVEASWAKNRNMFLRWEALETALRQVAETRNDMEQYWQLWDKGEWWWHINRSNITFGGHHRSRCLE